MPYGFLADGVVALHFAYVAFVVGGELVILLGLACRWQWVRNLWFRLTHLLFIGVVAAEAAFGVACPLTVWEVRLRELAGQPVEEGSFLGRLFHNLLFVPVEPSWLPVLHIGFGVLVLLTFLLAPPRRLAARPSSSPLPWGERGRG
jgi:hypothetical protein